METVFFIEDSNVLTDVCT